MTTRMRGWPSGTRSTCRKLVRAMSGASTKPTCRLSRDSRCDARSIVCSAEASAERSSLSIALRLAGGEGPRAHQGVDVDAVALVGRDPAGARVRVVEVARAPRGRP